MGRGGGGYPASLVAIVTKTKIVCGKVSKVLLGFAEMKLIVCNVHALINTYIGNYVCCKSLFQSATIVQLYNIYED